jgi:hypothetical protein
MNTQQQPQTPVKKQQSSRKRTTEDECAMTKRFKCETSPIFAISNKQRPLPHIPHQQPQLKRQTQSFTFIADLASTSTPTKKPIVSTPKARNHDPSKYHPTQTIRNKQIKQQLIVEKHQQQRVASSKRRKQIKIKYEKVAVSSNDQQTHYHHQQVKTTTTVNTHRNVKSVNNIEKYFQKSQPCTKRMLSERELITCRCCADSKHTGKKARYSVEPVVAAQQGNSCNLSGFVVSKANLDEISLIAGNMMAVMSDGGVMRKKTSTCSSKQQRATVSHKKSGSKRPVVGVATTTVTPSGERITLRDLMYTPSKLRRVECSSSGNKLQQQLFPVVPPKSSKVYYL